MRHIFLNTIIYTLILNFVPFLAFAENTKEKPSKHHINVCKKEINALCHDTKNGDKFAIKRCISINRFKLSKKCQDSLESYEKILYKHNKI